MKKILLYPITLLYYLAYLVVLCTIHPIQWVSFKIFGESGLQKSFDYTAYFTMKCTHILGASYTFENRELIPENVPVILVANHQSLYDIVGIIWFLRKHHAKFVSKKELGKGIPSVSYNLRHGGSILIDRKDPKQAIPLIKGLSEYIEKHKRSAVIFPEGTRTKTGNPKPFAVNGLKMLYKFAPDAYFVPITINNSWKMVKFGAFPMGLGNKLEFIIHEPMAVKDFSFEELIEKTEKAVVQSIKY